MVLAFVTKFCGNVLANILLSTYRQKFLLYFFIGPYFNQTFGLVVAPILVLLGTPLLSASTAISNVFGLIVIETTS